VIEFVDGDIFKSDADVLLNPINCVGIMGGGLALDFKRRYPAMYEEYKQMCGERVIRPGTLHFWDGESVIVCNFPTKDHWKDPSLMEYIVSGLTALREWCELKETKYSFAIPKIGCGLGGLKWTNVRVAIIDALETAANTIYVYGEKD
jgi:O-acetyl-ADP-ribose deacetylase (regulator of RNase III)